MKALILLVIAVGGLVGMPQGGGGRQKAWKHGLPTGPAYFPLAVWLQGPQNAPRYKAAGVNLYVGLWQGPTDEQLKALAAAGMPVICDQNEVGLKHQDDPTIVGWMHGDEPDNAQAVTDPATGKQGWGPCIPPPRIVADYERLRAKDGTRPVMLNLGQGVANDEWYGRGTGAKLSDYETYVQGCDIVSYDVYPVAGLKDGENKLWYVARGLDRLSKWTGGKKRIWNCIEVSRIDGEKQVTPAQMRAEVWMSLVHGSTGIIYFTHQFKPAFKEWAILEDAELLPAFTALNHQIRDLAPVLNSPTLSGGASVSTAPSEVPVDVMVKRHGGATYVFAVGMRNAPAQAKITVRGARAGARAEVIGESRSVAMASGAIEDDFAPFAVHLYRIR